MTVSSLRDRIITEMGVCHSDPSYTYPSPQEWQLDNPHAMSKTLAEVLGKAIYPEISTSTLLAWREAVINYYDPTGGLPSSPSVDDRYISTATANGWTADYIYTWDGSSWSGFVPGEGCTVYNESTDVHQTYNGTTWGTLTTVTKLDDIQDPDSSHVLTMADKTLTWRFTNPAGGMYFEWTGAASGHLLELNQNTGNPAAGTHLLHLEATDTDVVPIHIQHSAKTADAIITDVAGDSNYRFHLTVNGKIQWGSGSAVEDTNLYRSGAGLLRTDGSFDIGNIPNYSSGTNVLVSHSGVVKYRLVSDSILSVGDFGEAVDDRVNSLLVQGSGIVLNYDDVGNSLTVSLDTHALTHGDGGSDEISIDWSQITSGVPAQATDWPTWSQVTGKPTNFVYGNNITSTNSGYYTKIAADDQIEPASLKDVIDGATLYTEVWSRFRLISVDTNASSNKVVVLGSSNELERRDIDSRVWGSSLLSGTMSVNKMPKALSVNTVGDSIVSSGANNITITSASAGQAYQVKLFNPYSSNTKSTYIGQFAGGTHFTTNRYYASSSWQSDVSTDPGAHYLQHRDGYHAFQHFPANSNTSSQDFVVNGPSGYVLSQHNFRVGGNAINNNGTGGLTFDTEGKGTISATGTTHSYQLKLAGNNSRRAYLGMYGGNTYLTTNRYFDGSSWQSDITGAGIFYIQHNSGYHEFKHFASGSSSSTRDLLIDGSNTYTESLHYFRVKNKLRADLYEYSYLTTGSGSTGGGKWTRIARVNLTGQYQSAACTLEISGANSGASSGLNAKVRFRVKQQASLGDAPFIDLDVFDYQRLTENYFKAVTVQNDASATIVDLYVTMVDSYLNYVFTPYNVYQDSKFTFYSSDGLVSSLPAGAQTDAVPRGLVYSAPLGDATTPRDLDVGRYLDVAGYAIITGHLYADAELSVSSHTNFGGRLQTGGNWISYASGDRGMKIDDLYRAVFKIDDNRIGNIVLQNDYNSNTVKSYIGQYQDNLFICNNAYYSGDWYPDLSSDHSERFLLIDGVFRMEYSISNSPISWTSIFRADGPNGKAGFFTNSPASALHVHESSTGGTDEPIFRLTTASGGGFNILCSDLSSSNPTWTISGYYDEAMAFKYNNSTKLKIDGSTNIYGQVNIVTADGGNTHLGYTSDNNYITHQDAGGSYFRHYNTSTSAYFTMIQFKNKDEIIFNTDTGSFTVNSNTASIFNGRVFCGLTDDTKGGLVFDVSSTGDDHRLWEITPGGNQQYGYYLRYAGAGTGDANYLELYSHNSTGTDMLMYRAHQNTGFVDFPNLNHGLLNGDKQTVDLNQSTGTTGTTITANYIEIVDAHTGGGSSWVPGVPDTSKCYTIVVWVNSSSGIAIYADSAGISNSFNVNGGSMVLMTKIGSSLWQYELLTKP
jgi:hypothetical protein